MPLVYPQAPFENLSIEIGLRPMPQFDLTLAAIENNRRFLAPLFSEATPSILIWRCKPSQKNNAPTFGEF